MHPIEKLLILTLGLVGHEFLSYAEHKIGDKVFDKTFEFGREQWRAHHSNPEPLTLLSRYMHPFPTEKCAAC